MLLLKMVREPMPVVLIVLCALQVTLGAPTFEYIVATDQRNGQPYFPIVRAASDFFRNNFWDYTWWLPNGPGSPGNSNRFENQVVPGVIDQGANLLSQGVQAVQRVANVPLAVVHTVLGGLPGNVNAMTQTLSDHQGPNLLDQGVQGLKAAAKVLGEIPGKFNGMTQTLSDGSQVTFIPHPTLQDHMIVSTPKGTTTINIGNLPPGSVQPLPNPINSFTSPVTDNPKNGEVPGFLPPSTLQASLSNVPLPPQAPLTPTAPLDPAQATLTPTDSPPLQTPLTSPASLPSAPPQATLTPTDSPPLQTPLTSPASLPSAPPQATLTPTDSPPLQTPLTSPASLPPAPPQASLTLNAPPTSIPPQLPSAASLPSGSATAAVSGAT